MQLTLHGRNQFPSIEQFEVKLNAHSRRITLQLQATKPPPIIRSSELEFKNMIFLQGFIGFLTRRLKMLSWL